MKKLSLFLIPFLISLPVGAQQVNVFDECKRYIIEEEYIPGYYTNTGDYVGGRIRKNRKQVPCNGIGYSPTYRQPTAQQPQRRCSRNQNILGGLLGGGVAALVSKKDAYPWAIPLGVVSGVAVARADC